MRLIEASVENWTPSSYTQEEGEKFIEKVARICYKSEDKTSQDFVARLIKNGHYAMLEHGTLYLEYLWPGSVCDLCNQPLPDKMLDFYCANPHSQVVWHGNDVYITTNFRVIQEYNRLEDLEYMVDKPSKYHNKRYTFKFITSIGIVRELLRHKSLCVA